MKRLIDKKFVMNDLIVYNYKVVDKISLKLHMNIDSVAAFFMESIIRSRKEMYANH